jgi:hypothetical protein
MDLQLPMASPTKLVEAPTNIHMGSFVITTYVVAQIAQQRQKKYHDLAT